MLITQSQPNFQKSFRCSYLLCLPEMNSSTLKLHLEYGFNQFKGVAGGMAKCKQSFMKTTYG